MLRLSFKSLFLLVLLASLIPTKNGILAIDRRPESLAAVSAQTVEMQPDDLAITERIVHSYRRTAIINQNLGNSMWQLFFETRHQSLHRMFLTGTLNEISNILQNPHQSDLFYGFDNLAASLLPGFASPDAKQAHATICLDSLVRFAEAIGAVSLDNPEHYHYIPAIPLQADAIIDKINNMLGVQIVFPNPYPFENGLYTSYGIMSYRIPQSLYQAYRLKQMLKGIKNPRVLEIGAGLGRTAYYARLLGICDYTIVDIPFTAISSGYFLARTIGEENVLLSGEMALDKDQRVKILTPAEFLASNGAYDLILNADGFTEMDPIIAKTYWQHIEKVTPIFLSINHEANAYTVKSLIDKSDHVAEVTRYPYWMRKGYIEEIVRFK